MNFSLQLAIKFFYVFQGALPALAIVHVTDQESSYSMFSTEYSTSMKDPEKPKRLVIKGPRSGTKSKVLAANGKVALHLEENTSIVVEFETETDVEDFQQSILTDGMEVEVDALRYPQGGLRASSKYEGLDTTLFQQEMEQERHRQLYSQSQIIPWGISRIFNGTLPEPSYLPKTIKKPICVIDTGFDTTHPDLLNINVTSADGQDMEDCGIYHGTHIAGTIVAEDNSIGIVGIFAGAPITVVKVFSRTYCQYSYTDGVYATSIIHAAHACVDSGAKIISMSFGGTRHLTIEQDEFDSLSQQGILLFAASGNTGDGTINYPASYDSVISVAAVDENDQRALFSSYNTQVDLSAPGKGILSTVGPNAMLTLTTDSKLYAIKLMTLSAAIPSAGISAKACVCTSSQCPTSCLGKICIMPRGDIMFEAKGINCEDQGGIALVIYNYADQNFIGGTLPVDGTISIPIFEVTGATGSALVSNFYNQAMFDISAEGVPYDFYDGTSMATPHVSGAAYLLWNKYPSCSADQIKAALFKGAKDLATTGKDSFTGYGLLQYWEAAAALDEMNCSPQVQTSSSSQVGRSGASSSTIVNPSRSPTKTPVKSPSSKPSVTPSSEPSQKITDEPSAKPSSSPVSVPSGSPSFSPTDSPSPKPSPRPTFTPTKAPVVKPSSQPSVAYTPGPSPKPTSSTILKSSMPPFEATNYRSLFPPPSNVGAIMPNNLTVTVSYSAPDIIPIQDSTYSTRMKNFFAYTYSTNKVVSRTFSTDTVSAQNAKRSPRDSNGL